MRRTFEFIVVAVGVGMAVSGRSQESISPRQIDIARDRFWMAEGGALPESVRDKFAAVIRKTHRDIPGRRYFALEEGDTRTTWTVQFTEHGSYSLVLDMCDIKTGVVKEWYYVIVDATAIDSLDALLSRFRTFSALARRDRPPPEEATFKRYGWPSWKWIWNGKYMLLVNEGRRMQLLEDEAGIFRALLLDATAMKVEALKLKQSNARPATTDAQKPNKAPEPTPGSVTPRAIEGAPK